MHPLLLCLNVFFFGNYYNAYVPDSHSIWHGKVAICMHVCSNETPHQCPVSSRVDESFGSTLLPPMYADVRNIDDSSHSLGTQVLRHFI